MTEENRFGGGGFGFASDWIWWIIIIVLIIIIFFPGVFGGIGCNNRDE